MNLTETKITINSNLWRPQTNKPSGDWPRRSEPGNLLYKMSTHKSSMRIGLLWQTSICPSRMNKRIIFQTDNPKLTGNINRRFQWVAWGQQIPSQTKIKHKQANHSRALVGHWTSANNTGSKHGNMDQGKQEQPQWKVHVERMIVTLR